jgi:hypothetical protein
MRRGILIMGSTGGSLSQDMKKTEEMVSAFAKDLLYRILSLLASIRKYLAPARQTKDTLLPIVRRRYRV